MFDTGVELVTGIPGSGKSFFLVERLIKWITIHKRPVYTNLPLVHRVLRQYLRIKGGELCANLVFELTEERLNAFLDGFGTRQKYISDALASGTSRSASIKDWEEKNPDYLEWWIPAGSIIAVDEAHHWYPNPALSNVRKREPESLMTFLTMHRHGQYLVVFATQAERQLSTTVKSLCSTRFQVRRWDREPIMGTFSLEFLRFPILKYDKYSGEEDPEKCKPLDTFTRFPMLPWYQVYFRLYESFTHSGGKYEAERAVSDIREKAGLLEEKKEMPKNTYVKKFSKFVFKWFIRIFVFILIAIFFYRCGSSTVEDDNEAIKNSFTITGQSSSQVFTEDGSELVVGSLKNGFTLVLLDKRGVSYWRSKDGDMYNVQIGDTLTTAGGRVSKLQNN